MVRTRSLRPQSARHRVDHGTICGRSCANSGHYKPLCACVDRIFINPKFVAPAARKNSGASASRRTDPAQAQCTSLLIAGCDARDSAPATLYRGHRWRDCIRSSDDVRMHREWKSCCAAGALNHAQKPSWRDRRSGPTTADLCNLNHVIEVAREFIVRR
jgi:hypothetical protein